MPRTFLTVALLLTCCGCSISQPKALDPVKEPVYQPVQCLDRATELCAGVPERDYSTLKGVILGLGEALRALRDCQEQHQELTVCVSKHNAQVK